MSRLEELMGEDELCFELMKSPYKHGGRNPEEGFDCWQLIRIFYLRMYGVTLPDVQEYDEKFYLKGGNHFIENYHKAFEPCIHPVKHSMVLFYCGNMIVSHAGIVLADCKRFLHAGKGCGIVATELVQENWNKRIEGFYKYKEILS